MTELDLTVKPGVVAPDTKISLPGGKGAFLSTLDTGEVTGATPTLTVVGGFSYTFDCFVPGNAAILLFSVANPIPGGDTARATITSRVNNLVPRVLFTQVLPKTPKNGQPDYKHYKIALPPSDECVSLTFWVKPISGGTGAWATFVGPKVRGVPESQR